MGPLCCVFCAPSSSLLGHLSLTRPPQEDELIKNLVSIHGRRKWAVIAEKLPGRSGKQCRERFKNQLDPAIKREPWSADEDLAICKAQKRLGAQLAANVFVSPSAYGMEAACASYPKRPEAVPADSNCDDEEEYRGGAPIAGYSPCTDNCVEDQCGAHLANCMADETCLGKLTTMQSAPTDMTAKLAYAQDALGSIHVACTTNGVTRATSHSLSTECVSVFVNCAAGRTPGPGKGPGAVRRGRAGAQPC